MFCVTVAFQTRREDFEAFVARVHQQAADSLVREPGCRTFDVWTASARHSVFLYEIYDSRAAFEDHLASDHFLAFDREVAAWVTSKNVESWGNSE